MAQILCRILTALLLVSCPFGLSGKFTNAQEFMPIVQKPFNCGIFGNNNNRCQNGQCAPPSRGRILPRKRKLPNVAAAALPTSVVKIESVGRKGVKHGHGTHVKFNNKFFIVTCAHTLGIDFKPHVMVNGQRVAVQVLYERTQLDLAILSAPSGIVSTMPLANRSPDIGEPVTQAGRPGVVMGYKGEDIVIRGYVKDGDSGGPIYNQAGLVGVIATYTYTTGTNITQGATSGPSVALIARILKGLTESPPTPTLVNLPDKQLELQAKRITALEGRLKEAELGLQRTNGAVEVNAKGVELNTKTLEELYESTRNLTLATQRLDKRISISEKSTTALTTAVRQVQQGKVSFRLKIDQSGRVTGVE
jgi:hypothetical protein